MPSSEKKSIYLGAPILRLVEQYPQEGLTRVVNMAVDRYLRICEAHRPRLTREEWCLVLDALNGCWLLIDDDCPPPGLTVLSEVSDAIRINNLAEKWGVDGRQLLAQLELLDYAGYVSILDATTRFWSRTDLPTDEALAEAGVVPVEEEGG